jgi:hypothetical protein
MARFKITVVESVRVIYDEVEIDAEDEDEAQQIAEEMRVQGTLGTPCEEVDDVDYSVDEYEFGETQT